MKPFVAAAVLLLLLVVVVVVDARFVVEKSSITVLSPHKLRAKRDGAIGNFGLPDYGGFIVGSVLYPTKGSHGCQVFEGDKPFKIHSYRPTIVLLDRGGIYLSLSSLLSSLTLIHSLCFMLHVLFNVSFLCFFYGMF